MAHLSRTRLAARAALVAVALWRALNAPLSPQGLAFSRPVDIAMPQARHGGSEAITTQLKELEQPSSSRRDVLAGLLVTGALTASDAPARANVGEGDTLPNGARQEDRIRKGTKAWQEIGEKMVNGEVSTEEDWSNAQGLLRRLYSLQDDMTYLSRGFAVVKKKEAEKLITTFKKRVKESDKPAKAKDVEKFMVFHKEISGYIDDFMGMLNDAPQDIDVGEFVDVS
mmetsp:Transcript_37647/g.103436  ORF Transcript_37647/g.103436 Transcript_37647/m.103436 type:complete len:226 (+) Transcript_37647:47-724(+)